MKSTIRSFIRTFFVLAGIEAAIFITMIFFVMSDEPIGMIGTSLGYIVKNILGFPLVLINSEYPFFMNSSQPANYMIPLIILNLIIQTGIVMFLKNRITNILSFAVFLLLASAITGCQEAEVTITKDYVINPNWDEIVNSFEVKRMIFKVADDSINPQKTTPPELLNKLVEDTGFSFTSNVKYNGEKYSDRKVYFNRYNGFSWWKFNDIHSNYKQETIGKLQQHTWYLLVGLSNVKTLYYLYIDSNDSLHTYKVPASYWTNY